MNHEKFEQEFVHKFYKDKAKAFSDSRVKPWPYTKVFIEKYANKESLILDAGCGNGRQFIHDNIIGLDFSYNLLKDALSKKNLGLIQGNIHELPLKDKSFDIVLSIAVIHHLCTQERRMNAMVEMKRVLKDDGIALIYLWHKDSSYHSKFKPIQGDEYLVSWRGEEDAMRYYCLYDELGLKELLTSTGFEILEMNKEEESLYAVIKKII